MTRPRRPHQCPNSSWIPHFKTHTDRQTDRRTQRDTYGSDQAMLVAPVPELQLDTSLQDAQTQRCTDTQTKSERQTDTEIET